MLQLLPILAYSNNETSNPYPFDWAAHHLGYYPIGNIKPFEQENMPVEETANMLQMIAAIAKFDKNSLTRFGIYPHYWPLLKTWVDYLLQNLPGMKKKKPNKQ